MSSDEVIMDEVGHNGTFMCGVIEGFYGKPWTAEQRKELFIRMKRFGMDTYVYAPKDDYKHRLYWRELYQGEEADNLRELIHMSKEFDVKFVYAISPGLDMTLSSGSEVNLLKKKLDQVKSFGCECYALLFDDIEPEMSPEDRKVFSSTGEAQSKVTNELYHHLGDPQVFLFCPTEYCTSRADPSLLKSEYLQTIGKDLEPDIHILWTGPKVVSRRITVESICEIKEILRRPPTIWDNLHANDYDQTRVYLGPYDGRPQDLKLHLRGILTNPNCEFELNYMAMHTLAQWTKDTIQRFPTLDADAMEVDPPRSGYQPKRALFCAIEDWIPEFYKPKGARPSKKTLARITYQNCGNDITNEGLNPQGVKPGGGTSCRSDEDHMEVVPTYCDSDSNESSLDDLDQVSKAVKDKDIIKRTSRTIESSNESSDIKVGDSLSSVQSGDNSVSKSVVSDIITSEGGGGSPMDTTKEENTDGASSKAENGSIDKTSKEDDDNPDDSKSKDSKGKIDDIELLEMEDMLILCDLFYLPFEYGSRATHLLKKGHWLVSHLDRVKDVEKSKVSATERPPEVREWYENAIHFHDCFKEVVMMVHKLVNIPNRELLYELYNYVSDMRSALSLVNSYVKWNGLGKPEKEPFRGGEQEPWIHRSGIFGEFRRLLPIEGAVDMFPAVEKQPQPQHLYTIRPYFPEDLEDLYSVCRRTCEDGLDGSDMFSKNPDLVADDCIGAMLHMHPDFCFVLEDDSGICGYAVCVPDVKEFQLRLESEWLVKMREKYPDPCPNKQEDLTATEEIIKSFHKPPVAICEDLLRSYPSHIQLSILHGRTDGLAAARRLLHCAVRTLKVRGNSRGMHTMMHSSHQQIMLFHTKLEFDDLTDSEHAKRDLVVMGKRI